MTLTVRTRGTAPRDVELDVTIDESVEDERLLREILVANARKNAAGREEKSATAKLFSRMVKRGVDRFSVDVDGKPITASIAAGTKSSVNIPKLATLVTPKELIEMVSATQGAVKDKMGSVVLAKVLDTEATPKKLVIKK